MLVGRHSELARIEGALAAGRLGVASALVLRGEAGIGKTVLLQHAVDQAGGMVVLRARGVQFERDVPFAGLHELLRPALAALDRLPDAGARSLRSALGIGERVDSDRLLIGSALLQVLVADGLTPTLVAVDDAHWLDRASAETLAFAVRRLLADPVTVLIAIREGEASPLLEIGLPELALRGLDESASAQLLEASARSPLDRELARRILAATEGNPLAVSELAREAHRFGASTIHAPLPVATSVERAYLRRIEGVSPQARMALLVLAASGSAGVDQVRDAALRIGLGAGAVEEARSTPLVALREERLEFVHPLARAAVYHAAAPGDVRTVHRALSQVMGPEHADRRAWHLAAAAEGPDEEAASELEAAGRRAQLSTGYAEAAAAYEHAARLTPDAPRRAERELAGAHAWWLGGQPDRALSLLERVRSAEAGTVAGDATALAGLIALHRGEAEKGFGLVRAAAESIAGRDRLRAIHLLAEAALVGFGAARLADMREAGRRALDLLTEGDPPAARVSAHTAYGAAAIVAAIGDEGPRHLREAAAAFDTDTPLTDPLLMMCAGVVGLFLREASGGRELLDRALAGARAHAPTAALPLVLFYLGRDAATTDRWAVARARYEEGARLARETNQLTWLAATIAGLAHVDALEGRAAELLGHASEVEQLAGAAELETYRSWTLTARALLDLGAGRLEAARQQLVRLQELHAGIGFADPDVDPTPDLVEVEVRLGSGPEVAAQARACLGRAREKGQPFALARAERALGLLESGAGFRQHFEAALEYDRATSDTFEGARTRLLYGERLRRARQRRAARSQLLEALDTFERLGAPDWAARAAAELAATGAVPRGEAAGLTAHHRLTAQELQVALALAEGDTTRQAAAKLFISPKTVEYHLRNVYGKLDVRSRDELRAALGSARPMPPAPAIPG